MLATTKLFATTAIVLTATAGWADNHSGQTGSNAAADTENAATTENANAGEQQFNADARVATVGDTEITQGDVAAMAAAFPDYVRAQPPEVILSMAVEQAIMQELLLQAAQKRTCRTTKTSLRRSPTTRA
ncbi:hypothetical protein [Roseivivax sp. CAU 1761]